jgi:hypothetical protein
MTHLPRSRTITVGPATEPVCQDEPAAVVLDGAGATQQFPAVAAYPDGERDVTAEAEGASGSRAGEARGVRRLTAAADGEMMLVATFRGVRAQSSVRIGSEAPRTFSFSA